MGGSSSKNKKTKTAPPQKAKRAAVVAAPVPPPSTSLSAPRSAAKKHAQPTEASEQFGQRIRRFYLFHSPEKVNNVPLILRMWKGTQAELMQHLVARYGPEPDEQQLPSLPPPPPLAEPASVFVNMWVPRYARYLLAYNEQALQSLDMTLQQAQGREAEQLKSLVLEVGPEPQGPLPDGVPDAALAPHTETAHVDDADAHTTEPAQEAALTLVEEEQGEGLKQRPRVYSLKRRLSSFLGVRAPKKLHALEKCLERYATNEEELFDFLCDTYGPEPNEEETQAYFVRRLEALYSCYAPGKVTSAGPEIAAHHGEEEEYLQALAASLGADPMMAIPARVTHSHLFEYVDTDAQEEATGSQCSAPHPSHALMEPPPNELPREHDEQGSDAECVNAFDDDPARKPDAGFEDVAPPSGGVVQPSEATLGKNVQTDWNAEKYRLIAEDQQRQLDELRAEVGRLRSAQYEMPARFPHEGLRPFAVRERSDHSLLHSPDAVQQRPYQVPHVGESHASSGKSVLFAGYAPKQDFHGLLLPPPPFFKPPRDSFPKKRQPYGMSPPSLFVSRKSTSSTTRRVRTLTEMRVEYEREREAIRSGEGQLDPYNVLH
ncbi:hypothetical protein DQ04_02501040 [Trypanosoma grayi]|uniref:hypothetical protein n=1 Tax=Trypanosoma grayi TaxID=71804 RepID=UPI0004F45220|nr:hypothetical protein DQ04_02501040 [Trypanosoma grayi]KEG11556.1 hypothetical protein DQ04_02501040 [Trypanosoma grayi]